jgi:hypothetical protein
MASIYTVKEMEGEDDEEEEASDSLYFTGSDDSMESEDD